MKKKELPKRGQRTAKNKEHTDAKQDKKMMKKMIKKDCMK